MLLFVGTFLCPDLGITVNLCYLESLKRVGQIWNYDWGDMAYATLMHFMTQLSRRSLSNLGGAPFVWQAGCEGYVECEWALELNGCQALFECGRGRYWYLVDRVSSQVLHVYPPTTIPIPPCPSVRLHLLKEEEGDEEEEIPSPYHVGSSSSSFAETYPHFPSWQYDVMNLDGTYNSMPLTRPKHVPNVPWPDSVDVDHVEESMWMIGGL
ncbi:hypothetical protein SO802_002448 [Lithocarpus litseifolius]|uniref:Uncharacterized protein n=1 Tax=Lithocarpus litseifolius TaxID=425828 RepID=A0AAW2DYY2_9ROSI